MPAENWFWIVYVIIALGSLGVGFWKNEWRPFYVGVMVLFALLAYVVTGRGPIR